MTDKKSTFKSSVVMSQKNTKLQASQLIPYIINLFGATFGVGSTGLPGAATKVGILGFFIASFFAVLSSYFILTSLVTFSHENNMTNFVDLYKMIGGKGVKVLVLTMFLLTNIGTLLFASSTFNSLLAKVANYCDISIALLNAKSLFFMTITILAMFYFSIKRKLDGLSWITYVSFTTAIAVIFLLVLTVMNKHEYANHINKNIIFDNAGLNGTFNLQYFAPAYLYMMFCLCIQPSYMDLYQAFPNKNPAKFKIITMLFLGVMSFVYVAYSMLGIYAFDLNKDAFMEGKQFLTLFTKYKDPFIIICNALMIFAAMACFLFNYKSTKENIGLIIFGDKYFRDKSDYNGINLSLTFVIVFGVTFVSGLFILQDINGLSIIGFVVNLICPIVFMMFPLFAFYKQK